VGDVTFDIKHRGPVGAIGSYEIIRCENRWVYKVMVTDQSPMYVMGMEYDFDWAQREVDKIRKELLGTGS